MHDVWRIPELVDRICRAGLKQRDLSYLLRTCRIVYGMAESILWEDIDSFLPLLSLLPSDAVKLDFKKSYDDWVLSIIKLRPLTSSDWSTALYHGSQIRRFENDGRSWDYFESDDEFHVLLDTCPSPLFPYLQELTMIENLFQYPRSWHHFMNPALSSVFVILDHSFCLDPKKAVGFLDYLTTKCRFIEHLQMRVSEIRGVHEPEQYVRQILKTWILNNLYPLANLRALTYMCDEIDWESIDLILHCPNLAKLNINISSVYQSDDHSNHRQPHLGTLKDLTIETTALLATDLVKITSNANLTKIAIIPKLHDTEDSTFLSHFLSLMQISNQHISSSNLQNLRFDFSRNMVWKSGITFKNHVLPYIIPFTNLTNVALIFSPEDFSVTDNDIKTLAEALPKLKQIELMPSSLDVCEDPTLGSEALGQQLGVADIPTIGGSFAYLQAKCPNLEWFTLPVEAIRIPDSILSPSSSRGTSRSVTFSVPSPCPILDASAVAKFLLGAFPRLGAMEVDWESYDLDFMDMAQKTIASDYLVRWLEVASIIKARSADW